MTPPTGDAFSFALSPDGRQLVFVANGEQGSQLWLRSLNEVTARPLAATVGASYPFWSPDSSAVAFFADGKLKRLNLSGAHRRSWPTRRRDVVAPSALFATRLITTGGNVAVGGAMARAPQLMTRPPRPSPSCSTGPPGWRDGRL